MPRTIDEIINQAEELAARFEDHEPDVDEVKDASALRELRKAFLARAAAEQRVTEAVEKARGGRRTLVDIDRSHGRHVGRSR